MEGFFIKSCSIKEITDVEELLLKRYSNFDYILNLYYKDGFEFIVKAFEKENEDKLFKQWLVDYSRMNEDNFMSFEDYKKRPTKTKPPEEKLSKEQIEEKVKEIIEMTL